MSINRIFVYIFFIILKFLFFFFFYYYIIILFFDGPLKFISWLFFKSYISFIIKYFIPIYFILSFYSLKGHGNYYQLKFFGYDLSFLSTFFINIKKKLKSLSYIYTIFIFLFFICIFLFFLTYSKVKIYIFFIIPIFILFIFIYFFYNICLKLKPYIENYFIYFSLSFIIGLFYILNMDNSFYTSNLGDIENREGNYADLVYKISSPRWLFKSAHIHWYPEYKNEINLLRDGLSYYNSYLNDVYLYNRPNLLLNLSYNRLIDSINDNLDYHNKFLDKVNLIEAYRLKNINTLGHFNDIIDHKAQYLAYDGFLFDLILNKNKCFNCSVFSEMIRKHINFKTRNIYARSFLDELGLSKNLLINTNFNGPIFSKQLKNIYITDFTSSINYKIDECIDTFIIKKKQNLYFNNLKHNNFIYFNQLHKLYLYKFLKLDENCIKDIQIDLSIYENTIPIYNYTLISNINLFLKKILIPQAYSYHDFYVKNLQIENSYVFQKKLIYKNYMKSFDLESYLGYLYESIKILDNEDLLNQEFHNNLYIILLDNTIKTKRFWNAVKPKSDAALRDSFSIYRGLNNNMVYLYSGNNDKINLQPYHEHQREGGVRFSTNRIPLGAFKKILNYNDVKHIYFRFLNYNKYYEIFRNSDLWLFINNHNIESEKLKYLKAHSNIFNEEENINILNAYLIKNENFLNEDQEAILKSLDNDIKVKKAAYTKATEDKDISEENMKKIITAYLESFALNNVVNAYSSIMNVLFNSVISDDEDRLFNAFLNLNKAPEPIKEIQYINSYNLFYKKFKNLCNSNYFLEFDKLKNYRNSYNSKLKLSNTYINYIILSSYYDFLTNHRFMIEDKSDYFYFYDKIKLTQCLYMKDGDFFMFIFKDELNELNKSMDWFDVFLKECFMQADYLVCNYYKDGEIIYDHFDKILHLLHNSYINCHKASFNNKYYIQSMLNEINYELNFIMSYIKDDIVNKYIWDSLNFYLYVESNFNNKQDFIGLLNYHFIYESLYFKKINLSTDQLNEIESLSIKASNKKSYLYRLRNSMGNDSKDKIEWSNLKEMKPYSFRYLNYLNKIFYWFNYLNFLDIQNNILTLTYVKNTYVYIFKTWLYLDKAQNLVTREGDFYFAASINKIDSFIKENYKDIGDFLKTIIHHSKMVKKKKIN